MESKILQYAPKYIRIRESLREKIQNSTFLQDEQLPTETELMDLHGVSRITVSNAIKDLVKDGLLTRTSGKGTFVVPYRKKIQSDIVGLFMPTTGHLWGDFSRNLLNTIQSHGYCPLVYDPALSHSLTKEKNKIERLCNEGFQALIIDGQSTFPFEFLKVKKIPLSKLIFILHFETPLPFPEATKILADYEEGSYLALDHLFSLGHKKVLFFTADMQPEPYFVVRSLLAGCRRACRKHGLNPEKALPIQLLDVHVSEKNVENLVKVLSVPHRPTGIFVFGDSRAKDIFSAVKKLKMSIPEDLAVVGYYNTPWCTAFEVPLTSVSNEEGQCLEVVSKILASGPQNDDSCREPIFMKPRLVIRESSQAHKRIQFTERR